jgi:hypothetical protein
MTSPWPPLPAPPLVGDHRPLERRPASTPARMPPESTPTQLQGSKVHITGRKKILEVTDKQVYRIYRKNFSIKNKTKNT